MKQHIPNLDLNLLKAFVITYRERNLKRAAQIMALTPPAVSIKLSKLTHEVGGELFIKVPSGFEPTALADKLYTSVEPLLHSLYNNIANLQGFEPAQLNDHIVMDLSQHFISWFGPGLYQIIHKIAPGTSLTTNAFTANTFDRLRKDEVDVGIQYARVSVPKDIIEVPLDAHPMLIMVGKDHPIKSATASLKELARYDLAMIEINLTRITDKGHFVHEANKYGVNLTPKFTAPSTGAVANILANSTMFCPGSQQIIDLYPDSLRAIDLVEMQDLIKHPVSAYIHRRNRHSVKHNWLLELIKNDFLM